MNLRRRVRFREEQRSYIDVVPLVDTLLAVFLFLAILAFQSPETFIALKLPFAETGEKIKLKALKIQVKEDGTFLYEGKNVSEEDIVSLLKEKNPDYLVIEADEDAKHKFVVKLMDLARKNGIENIVIAVRRKR